MVMIIGTLAWAFAAFFILHDNAKTRRDLKSYQGQFDGNMKSFWSRLFDGEKLVAAEQERLNNLSSKTSMEMDKLEQRAFFELNELREALAQNVDNMADRNAAYEVVLNQLTAKVAALNESMIKTSGAVIHKNKTSKYAPIKRSKKSTASRARA